MLSIFKKDNKPDVTNDIVPPDSLPPSRMNLEERKAFRGEMIQQVIRESLQALDIKASAYCLRVMPLDVRHHRFIAMIDVGHSFEPQRSGGAWNFPEVETFIQKSAIERFGLLLDGIYWRIGTTTTVFERRRRERDEITTKADRAVDADIRPGSYRLVSDEEKQALMEAIRQGSERPVLRVGDQEYQTDMAPLDGPGSQREP